MTDKQPSNRKIKYHPEDFMSDREIMSLYHSGDRFSMEKAKSEMISKCEGLIRFIINSYISNAEDNWDDYCQTGREMILLCMKNYNTSKGTFATYCRPWVISGIIEQNRFFNCPGETIYEYGVIRDIRRSISELESQGEDITAKIISERTGFSLKIVKKNMEKALKGSTEYLNDFPDKDFIAPEHSAPEYLYLEKEKNRNIETLLSLLNPLQREIVYLRFGKGLTQTRIAQQLNCTVYYIKKYLREALQNMKTIADREDYF